MIDLPAVNCKGYFGMWRRTVEYMCTILLRENYLQGGFVE